MHTTDPEPTSDGSHPAPDGAGRASDQGPAPAGATVERADPPVFGEPTTVGAPGGSGAIAGPAPDPDTAPPASRDEPSTDTTAEQQAHPPDAPSQTDTDPGAPGGSSGSLLGYLAVYTLLRVALVVLLTAGLMFFMPLIVALLFAIIVQLPLSWLLFAGPRRRVNEAMARSSARRRQEREKLQSALSGEDSLD